MVALVFLRRHPFIISYFLYIGAGNAAQRRDLPLGQGGLAAEAVP